jgi:hypothetical protein
MKITIDFVSPFVEVTEKADEELKNFLSNIAEKICCRANNNAIEVSGLKGNSLVTTKIMRDAIKEVTFLKEMINNLKKGNKMYKEIYVKLEKDNDERYLIATNVENQMNENDKYGVYRLKEMRIMKVECKPVKCS